ncbi:MAG: alpha/beta hydrolase [Rhodobacteraceae bacterium]|jgi:pimeloyl-ACP methyl ester carboxylesterase|nr:alpha/beta hydrolase [Paracoccaceae bacterium]
MPDMLTTPQGRRIAYHRTPGRGPGVVFLGGFRSDMTGTKAMDLQSWATATGRAFVRFDYSGHGASDGQFADLTVSDWAQDAAAVLDALTDGPQVLVGSSMGGWIALLMARARPDRIAGLVGIAAAPDFTEDLMWAGWDAATRARLMAEGRLEEPTDYAPDPYVITRALIEDGRRNLVLRDALPLPFPVRLVHGTADTDVPMDHALKLFRHATGPDIRLTMVKDADHRMSDPGSLALIRTALTEVLTHHKG